jgi:uncharacterized protein YbjT (DUF2867 family)
MNSTSEYGREMDKNLPVSNERGRTALLLGASGLVGGRCLRLLLEDSDYSEVVAVVRAPLGLTHAKLKQLVVDFDRLEESAALVRGDDVFCCLGTTIKKAGSQQAFIKVDQEYTCQAARISLANGASQFLLVSSIGADAGSRVFYSRVKGRVEAEVSSIGFDGVQIFRPSLLLGKREETRTAEKLAGMVFKTLPFLFTGPLRKYRPIEARVVASAMLRIARENRPGVSIFESREIEKVGTPVR